jgi:hypothetical protein
MTVADSVSVKYSDERWGKEERIYPAVLLYKKR